MRYYLDTEFNEHGGELISLALDTGRHVPLYIVSAAPLATSKWIFENVMKNLHAPAPVEAVIVGSPLFFGDVIRNYIGDDQHPVIAADSPVDIWRFCEVLSTGDHGGWRSTDYPRMTFEVHNVDCYPTELHGAVQHNALWDAMALRHKLESS